MEDYFEGFSEEITRWEIIKEMIDLDLDDEFNTEHKLVQGVQLLPRQDVILYGTIPKIEKRIYTKCKECRLVFNPRDISSHKTCPGKSHSSSHGLEKKIKSKGGSSKKSHSSLPPPPLFKKPPCPSTTPPTPPVTIPEPANPKLPIPKPPKAIPSTPPPTPIATPIAPTPTPPPKAEPRVLSPSKSTPKSTAGPTEGSSSSSSSGSSSRHKKSRKSNSSAKITKEFDPDTHCGVVEGSRGPCTRSITCSNHRIQLRKLVPGRSKDIHQLIAERKTAKEKELKHGSNCSYMSPNGQGDEKDSFSQTTTYATDVAASASEPSENAILPKNDDSSTLTKQTTTSLLTAKQPITTDPENISSKTMDNSYIMNIHSQESAIGTVPVVYIPMSPISVVSPVQFVQIGKNVICLESPQSAMSPPVTSNQSVYLTIPSQNSSNVKMYKSHPKPAAVPNYGGKKVGGAILLLNQRVENQRNKVLMAINAKRKTVNNSHSYRAISLLNHNNNNNNVHRPNILKVKGVNKVNCKRSANDKLIHSDNKQMRLTPNVNGFILHSDISETADAPHSNNCLQEKIALLNMK
ncbi:unnamed protein product [Phaedon cochleariae]|uniref:SCA7 domain-containing protein n=1 Tax=Phaedon cochleariae TaxID=80249 RepID=A0A9N9SEC1_PHACE|nr:unnamed protein product [Phaedon cochleariae]